MDLQHYMTELEMVSSNVRFAILDMVICRGCLVGSEIFS